MFDDLLRLFLQFVAPSSVHLPSKYAATMCIANLLLKAAGRVPTWHQPLLDALLASLRTHGRGSEHDLPQVKVRPLLMLGRGCTLPRLIAAAGRS